MKGGKNSLQTEGIATRPLRKLAQLRFANRAEKRKVAARWRDCSPPSCRCGRGCEREPLEPAASFSLAFHPFAGRVYFLFFIFILLLLWLGLRAFAAIAAEPLAELRTGRGCRHLAEYPRRSPLPGCRRSPQCPLSLHHPGGLRPPSSLPLPFGPFLSFPRPKGGAGGSGPQQDPFPSSPIFLPPVRGFAALSPASPGAFRRLPPP